MLYAAKVISLDRIGSIGVLLAAVAAPCCFPLFAAIGAAAGFSALGQYEGVILYIFQGFTLLTLVGLALSYRRHRDGAPLVVGGLACANLAYHFYWEPTPLALYGGLAALILAAILNYLSTKRGKQPILQSTITCPHCGHKSKETMPTDACLFFFDCPACKALLKPKTDDCCVFCSYGSVPCPPVQTGSACCT